MFKLMGKKIMTLLSKIVLLNLPYGTCRRPLDGGKFATSMVAPVKWCSMS